MPGKLDVKNRLIVRGAREHNLPVNRRTPQQIVDDLLGRPEGARRAARTAG